VAVESQSDDDPNKILIVEWSIGRWVVHTTLSLWQIGMATRRFWFLAVTVAAFAINGCSLIDDLEDELNDDDDDEIVHCQSGRPTEIYFSDAVRYNSSQQRWVFHNWKGTGSDGGCDIHINVHDSDITLSQTVRQAITAGATAWRNAIVANGVRCDVYVHFESQGDSGSTVSPRIDMEFVELLNGGDIAGSTTVAASPAARTFSHVRIQIASHVVEGNDTLTIPLSTFPALITHEYGHAFGILGYEGATGHSSEEEDVMFPTADCSALSAGDIATMREAYTRVPFYAPVASGSQISSDTREIRVLCKY